MDPHETTRPARPGASRATAPPTRPLAPQGPTLGGLIDAYLQGLPGAPVPVPRRVTWCRERQAVPSSALGRTGPRTRGDESPFGTAASRARWAPAPRATVGSGRPYIVWTTTEPRRAASSSG